MERTEAEERAGSIETAETNVGYPPIDDFRGRHAFLSNFYLCVVRVSPADLLLVADSVEDQRLEDYPSAEHAFQAGKTRDAEQRRAIREASLPSRAKRLGGRRGIATLRSDWEAVKEEVMLAVLRAKFSDPTLAAQLLATGDRLLVEGNTWGDAEWGRVRRDGAWFGQNKLGRLLEVVRREAHAG